MEEMHQEGSAPASCAAGLFVFSFSSFKTTRNVMSLSLSDCELRVPPKSATREVRGYTNTSVSSVVALETAQREKLKSSCVKDVVCS